MQPDLTVLGKVIGGGLPRRPTAAARAHGAGRARRRRLPGGHAERQSARGGCRARDIGDARRPGLPALGSTTEALADGLREAAGTAPVHVVTAPGLLTVFFSQAPVRDYADAKACDLEAYAAWCRALLARGVYPPPSQFEAWFPSLAHTPEHLERTVDAAAAAFREVF